MTEREKAKLKISKLLNMNSERGASEAEALSASRKAAELMAVFSIEIHELGLDKEKKRCKQGAVKIKTYGKKLIADQIAMAVARLCDCKVWVHYTKEFMFFGFEEDVEFACYLQEMIINSILSELEGFKTSDDYLYGEENRLSQCRSFILGIESRLGERISHLVVEKAQAVKKATGTSLVLIKTNKVDEEFDELGMTLRARKRRSRGASSRDAFSAGRSRGDHVDLNRKGVGSGSQGLLS